MSEPAETPVHDEMSMHEVDRMWELALHEESVLNERSALFLVAHAMLLIMTVETRGKFHDFVVLSIIVIGGALSVIWLLINARQLDEMQRAAKIAGPYSEGYVRFRQLARRTRFYEFLRTKGPALYAFGVPSLVAAIYVVLLADTLVRAFA